MILSLFSSVKKTRHNLIIWHRMRGGKIVLRDTEFDDDVEEIVRRIYS